MSDTLRSAIEALEAELQCRSVVVNDDIDDGRIEERCDILKRICAILAAPSPSREELRAKIAWEIEKYCGDDDEGKGASKTWTQWKSDFADRILALLPEESDLTDATLPLMPNGALPTQRSNYGDGPKVPLGQNGRTA